MNTIVADASFCGAWILPDEATEAAEAILRKVVDGSAELLVPSLWQYEMSNLLWAAHRRGRLKKREVIAADEAIGRIPIRSFDVPDAIARRRVLELAFQYDLSAYDAAYLELALRVRVPLYTNDVRLRKAADKAGV